MLELRELSKALAARIPSHLLENLANYAAVREAAHLLPARVIVRDRGRYFEAISDFLGGPYHPLTLLEFGVYRGDSLRQWAELNRHPDSRLVGFDSFTGLPERWRGRPAGYFDCQGRSPAIPDARVSFVAGWFNRTLPGALDRLLPVPAGHRLLVHLDADLYSAALYCLSTLSARVGPFAVMFDEFGAGEGRALRDLLAAYGGSFWPHLGLKRHARSTLPTRVFGVLHLGGTGAGA